MNPRIRCAIYTRKSSEEGLEQSFNSLDAQREACEAFVKSQQHEGWQTIATHYDDGGFSGGNMDRPAFKQLMADIHAGKISTVVVYKVDRLTRSLADFAKIIELFDKFGVSFVSVTQQFNTTTSMGRLTLNVLLSFAQFEREVTGERIRDKIAASKKKGMWMGGTVPLGYDVHDRQLQINEAEATTVRTIFNQFPRSGNVTILREWLRENDIRNKAGNHFFGGPLYQMLHNPLYIGLIGTRQIPTLANTKRSSILRLGIRCKRCSPRTARAANENRVQPKPASLPGSSLTLKARSIRQPTQQRTAAATATTPHRQ
jgi:DNA invertase Pin-like site-specific DNA recombinase